MPTESIESCNPTKEDPKTDNEIFTTEDDVRRNIITNLCYGDLYIIGRLWIRALETALVGATITLIPVVKAAKPTTTPEKPPPMKYTDLPIYQSPHYEYKDYLEDAKKCPKAKVKLVHEYLLPTVKSFRRSTQRSYCELKCDLREMKNDLCGAVKENKMEFKRYMRDSQNLRLRQGVTALGGVAGFYIGSGKGVPRRILFTGLGLLTTGALCFPKETDEAFRNVVYHTGKFAISIYNSTCGKNLSLRERLPCSDDLPPPPKTRKSNVCPDKK